MTNRKQQDFGMGDFMAKLAGIAPPPVSSSANDTTAATPKKKSKRKITVVRKRRKITVRSVLNARDLAKTQKTVNDIIKILQSTAANDCKLEELLGLMYIQEGRLQEAKDHLLQCGYYYRLSNHVLGYPFEAAAATKASKQKSQKYVTAFDNVLPDTLFDSLKHAFRPNSPFWAEHNYRVGVTPYFSYRHDLDSEPTTIIDQAIQEVASLMIKEILSKNKTSEQPLYAEWWVHSRPHPHGHQMHFDADNEGKGGVRNPLANCILFLSEGCGGPTLVTSQEYGKSELSQEGWLAYSKENRIVAYPANVLHGVIPGRGPVPDPSARRLTLMIALWGKSGCKLRPSPVQGASRPYPVKKQQSWYTDKDPKPYSWPSEFVPTVDISSRVPVKRAFPSPIPHLWDDVCPDLNTEEGRSLSQLTKIPHYDHCFQGF
eukprot:TRINITY_DN15128_c0_g1_i2.p1 TRINITY_DN15128_c0_g1~~TRINITY_DN15128_c0_g1_i2.p1  ORF type:complete len:443 (+),score=65.95 TRINITY_DN15128_c0_g1_i2:40-1329(+)